jgi:hypothetical protein
MGYFKLFTEHNTADMKTNIILTGLLIIFMTGQLRAQGSTYRSGNIVRISDADSIQTQLFATGGTVEILGWIGNDLISASDILVLDGEIMDDAIISGSDLYVRGTVHDLLAAAGETIVLDGQIYGDVFAAGATIRITNNAVIRGNANLAANHIMFEGGIIEGNLKVTGRKIDLNGVVKSKTQIHGYNIHFGPEYSANFGTDIFSDRPIYPENLGDLPEDLFISEKTPNVFRILLFKSALYFSLFIAGILLIQTFKRTSRDLYKFSTGQFWKHTGIGLLTFLFYPVLLIILAALVFTLPISFLLLMVYGLLLLIGYLLVAMVVGVSSLKFLKKNDTDISYNWGLLVGMVLVAVIVNLPFLGWLFHAIFIFFGLGSLTLYLWHMRNLTQVKVKST